MNVITEQKGIVMEFAKRFSVVLAMSLTLMGCGSSMDKQVSQLSETVTKLQQETDQCKGSCQQIGARV